MAVEILMPELGESVHEGTVSRWLKKVGDVVREDEPIVEIMTDKVNTELPAPASGILVQILIPEGSLVEVFHSMGVIDDTGEGVVEKPEGLVVPVEKEQTKESNEPVAARVVEDGRQWYTPVVRAMAKQHSVSEAELGGISGSGAGAEVDVTNMVKFREQNKESFQSQFGVKLTYTPFFIKAISETLMEFPLVNAALMPDNNILKNKNVHMGVAVSLGAKGDEGLIVPVIRDANTKTLIEIAKDLEGIAAKARANALGVPDVQGGTFTLTNPGSYGAVLGTPMINSPQAAILGTYTIKKMPVIIDEMIAIRSVMNLVLTYDHRIVDGMLAGRFLLALKQRLEKFDFFK
ncbi:MAG: 2-oxo acid dehydrogenase subunit E2 [Armatimonadetes bacterium]|nr:2-oxo acid dehydrogenase subunit E2 [Armatimonadota bacterium]